MRFSIIAVGNEVLSGSINNTTTKWLVNSLVSIGFSPKMTAVVPDLKAEIQKVLRVLFDESELIILTGGLGPTPDDLTKSAVAEFLSLPMVFSDKVEHTIKDFFKNRGIEMPKSNLNQAHIPKNSIILQNSFGTAPGIKIEKDRKIIILLPGPPRELEPMWNNHVLPTLETNTKEFHRDFYVLGLPESKMADILGNILNTENPISVAPYAGLGQIRLRVSTLASDEKEFDEKSSNSIGQIKRLLKDHIFDHPAPETLLKILREKGWSIATAESCTGGLIAKTLTDISGASDVFMGSAVTYSNQAKMDILGVSEESLSSFGAVSSQVAKEMAQGAKRVFKTDVTISTTGIAGPTGGTAEKPVGLVYMGISTPNGVSVIREVFTGTRDDVRIKTLMRVLWEAVKQLRGK